jgi:uncharacterized protein YndB with AHSA1/START domain
MSVTSVDKDFDALTLTLIADFDATAERVWELWADPRQLERWWGPPTHPVTMVEHDLTAGGEVAYYMTSPEGDKYHGWWRFTAVNPPKSLEFIDGFADSDGKPVEDMPTNTVRMQLSGYDGGTRMELRSTFDSREQMDQLMGMGMAEGLEQAIGQIDALLAG